MHTQHYSGHLFRPGQRVLCVDLTFSQKDTQKENHIEGWHEKVLVSKQSVESAHKSKATCQCKVMYTTGSNTDLHFKLYCKFTYSVLIYLGIVYQQLHTELMKGSSLANEKEPKHFCFLLHVSHLHSCFSLFFFFYFYFLHILCK